MAHQGTAPVFLVEPPQILHIADAPLTNWPIPDLPIPEWNAARVHVAKNKNALCNVLNTVTPDVVIAETASDSQDLLEIISLVRGHGCDAPLLLLINNGEEAVAQQALAHGADAYVPRGSEQQDCLEYTLRVLCRNAEEKRRRMRAEATIRFTRRFFDMASRHRLQIPMMQELVQELRDFTGCRAVGVRLPDEDHSLPLKAHIGFPAPKCLEEPKPAQSGLRLLCAQVASGSTAIPGLEPSENGSVRINTPEQYPAHFDGSYCDFCRKHGFASMALIPIRLNGQIAGILHLADPRPDRIPEELLLVLEEIGAELGAALHRMRVEAALRDGESRYALATEAGKVGVWDLRPQTGEFYSGTLRTLLGYSEDEIEDRFDAWRKVIYPEDRSWVVQSVQHCLEGHAMAFEAEHRIVRKDGEVRWVLSAGALYRDQDGLPCRLIGTVTDINDKKLADEALRAVQERLTLALDGAHLGMWDWDIVSGRFFLNQRSLEIIGSAEYNAAFSWKDWCDRIHPDDLEIVRSKMIRYRQAQKPFYEAYYRIQSENNNWRWVLSRGKTVLWDEHGQPERMVGTHLDITERKVAEEALAWESANNAGFAEISKSLIATKSLEETATAVLKTAQNMTDSTAGFVGYIDKDTGWLICPTLTRDISDACNIADKPVIFKEFTGLWGWVLIHGISLLANDPASHDAASGTPHGHVPILKFIAAPAIADNCVVGIIALANAPRDYTQKDLQAIERLAAAYTLALQRNHIEMALEQRNKELEAAVVHLQEAMSTVKRLRGMLPICMNCKCIRDDAGYWHHVESYIRDHSEADFSHSLCPKCAKTLYPDIFTEP